MPTELDKHIEYLRSVNDCREDFWRRIKELIHVQNYNLVFTLISNHRDDIDYNEQIRLMAGEIAAQHPWRA